MKAFILGAGLGTRLQSLDLKCPKVMVPIGDRPLLQHHVELLREQGICDLIVNLHHLPDSVTSFFGDGSKFGVHITYSLEPQLLGTAGAVKKMEQALGDGTFIVLYGDNLLRLRFAPLLDFHRSRGAVVTLALYESPEPWTGGVVDTDATGRIVHFVEKPDRNRISTNWINGGIYLVEPSALEAIPEGMFCDFGKDVFPQLLADGKPMYALKPDAYICDVGTPERLAKAQQDYATGVTKEFGPA